MIYVSNVLPMLVAILLLHGGSSQKTSRLPLCLDCLGEDGAVGEPLDESTCFEHTKLRLVARSPYSEFHMLRDS